MKRFLLPLLLCPVIALAQIPEPGVGTRMCLNPDGNYTSPNCTAGASLEVAITGVSGVQLPNNEYLTATDAAGTGTISMLKADGTDDTVLNAKSGELIKLSENGTAGTTLDPSTNGFTFASPAELGSDSTTDGISSLRWTNGTGKAAAVFDASHNFQIGPVTAGDLLMLLFEGNIELAMSGTSFYPGADAGSSLGTSTSGWKGLYLSDGTDRWSLVPGVNLLTLAAGTSDGADDQTLKILAGGADGTTRGAGITLLGDDVGGAGAGAGITYEAATGTAGSHKFNTAGTLKWTIGTDLTQDATNGGNIVMSKDGTGLRAGIGVYSAEDLGGMPGVFVSNNTYHDGFVSFRGDDNVYGPGVGFYKTRATNGTANTPVSNGFDLGHFYFHGADGTGFQSAARIFVRVDGNVSAGDMPGRIEFLTTPDGTASPREAMRISQDQSLRYTTPDGGYMTRNHTCVAKTTNGGGATETISSIIPAGAVVLGVTCRVDTEITGAGLTTWSLGDGVDADLYGTGLALAAGTTVGTANYTASPRTQAWGTAAKDLTMTAAAGVFSAGVVTCCATHETFTGPAA